MAVVNKNIAFALLLVAAIGHASPDQTGSESEQQTEQDPLNTEAAATENATPAASTKTEQTRAPEDYRASEQISDDLSVSFPVDI